MSDITMLGAAELARRIKKREISPVEITRATLEKIERLNPRLNAFITVTAEQALEAARAAEAQPAEGLLHGVPISLKDLIATRGIRTTAGSKILADWIPAQDATVTTRLKDAGAILIGKTNLHEFAYGLTNDNPHYGPTLNPWDPERITGGSSGGSASAVATGMGVASIGTDTACSIRIPAAFCGIVGLKPTYGRVSRAGVIPLSWSLDHIGPLTRNVEDAALLLGVIAGHDPHDSSTSRLPVPDYCAVTGDIRGLRLGLIRDYSLSGLQPDIEAVVRNALRTLEQLGVQIVEVDLPRVKQANTPAITITGSEASTYHDKWLPQRADEYGSDVLTLLMMGRGIAATNYLQAQRLRRMIFEETLALFNQVDVLFVPAAPAGVPRFEEVRAVETMDAIRAAITQFMRIFNVTGLPTLVMPAGLDRNKMPVGVQFASRPYDEATLLRLGRQFEQATGFQGLEL